MKKTVRIAALLMALALLLGLAALASGEASAGSEEFNTNASVSGEAESTALFTVDGRTVTEREGSCSLTGEIGPASASGIELTVDEFTASGIQVVGGEYVIEDSVIVRDVSPVDSATASGGYCAGVTDGVLTIKNSVLTAKGKGGVFGNYTVYCAENGTLVVITDAR